MRNDNDEQNESVRLSKKEQQPKSERYDTHVYNKNLLLYFLKGCSQN